MPNYAWNRMSMKASDYKKYVEGIDEDGNPTVDFNVLIPMPKCYEGIPSGTETDMAFVCYVSNKLEKGWTYVAEKINELLPNANKYKFSSYKIDYDRLSSDVDLDTLYSKGEQIVENIKNYNAIDWYDWCCDNWGTKWNAFDVEVEDIDEENDICWFKFTTAWCAPEGWIKELSKHCDFTINCEVEGSDTRYRYVCENGVLRYFESDFVEKELKS